jgi:hypothetical protein
MVLLVFAAAVVTAALVLVDAAQLQPLSAQLVWLGAGYLGLFAAAYVAVRRFTPYADPVILPVVALLNGLGLVMIHRLDLAGLAHATQTDAAAHTAAVPQQLLWTGFAVVLLVVCVWRIRDHRVMARYGYTCGLVGLVLLALPGSCPPASRRSTARSCGSGWVRPRSSPASSPSSWSSSSWRRSWSPSGNCPHRRAPGAGDGVAPVA